MKLIATATVLFWAFLNLAFLGELGRARSSPSPSYLSYKELHNRIVPVCSGVSLVMREGRGKEAYYWMIRKKSKNKQAKKGKFLV